MQRFGNAKIKRLSENLKGQNKKLFTPLFNVEPFTVYCFIGATMRPLYLRLAIIIALAIIAALLIYSIFLIVVTWIGSIWQVEQISIYFIPR